MSKPTLYVDVDDAIIAKCHHGSGFDLRPGVITQLRVLSRLFNCQWLTCWDQRSIFQLIKLLYGGRINSDLTYANWDHGHPWRKAGYVLNEKAPKNWWWIEDPLCSEEIEALKNAGKLYRYIRVEPFGNWAFLDAINELFLRSGVGGNINPGATVVVGTMYVVSAAVAGSIAPSTDLTTEGIVTNLGIATTASNILLAPNPTTVVKP